MPRTKHLAIEGEKAFTQGHFTEAELLYKKAITPPPNDASLLVSRVTVNTHLGNITISDTLLRHAIFANLSNSVAWFLLGLNAFAENRDNESFAYLVQTTLCAPENTNIHNYLGMVATQKGGWTEISEQEAQKVAELDPSFTDLTSTFLFSI